MKKQLVTIEFRYYDIPESVHSSGYKSKTITIGIFETIEEAISEGNKAIAILATKFEVRSNDRFIVSHIWGHPKTLATNVCYPTNRVQYIAKVTELKYEDLNEAMREVFSAAERYKKHEKEDNDEE